MTPVASALYTGTITHARRGPAAHTFTYRTYMLYLDLDELPLITVAPWFGIERARPMAWRRRDYLGDPARPLDACVRELVASRTGAPVEGPIRMLTHVRTLGRVFNPVTFYYCFDRAGRDVVAIAAEITNTPWNERHTYVVPAGGGDAFAKQFHVSPFWPMAQTYRWTFSAPAASLTVEMENREGDTHVFGARLVLERRPLDAHTLAREALRQPVVAWKGHAAIYWQALRLWMKGATFHAHPGT